MWTLESPYYMIFFLIFPLLGYIVYKQKSIYIVSFSHWKGSRFLQYFSFYHVLYYMSYALLWLGLSLLIIALSKPSLIVRTPMYQSNGINIMIVLDISPSMGVSDFNNQTRLSVAQSIIDQFMNSRKNDAIGLVSFSTDAIVNAPLTYDYNFVRDALYGVRIIELGIGTATGMGLSLALAQLENSGNNARNIIILLTDGVTNIGEIAPEQAAEIARKLQVPVYVVGIGSLNDAIFETTDLQRNEIVRGVGRKLFNKKSLEYIARTSGGRYFNAFSATVLDNIFQEINNIESSERVMRIKVEKIPLYLRVLQAAGLAIIISFFLRRIVLGILL